MSALGSMTNALRQVFPVLRQGSETKQGPHRSATPESMQMKNTATTLSLQQSSAFVREGFVAFTPAHAETVLRECRYERQRDETRAKGHISTLAEYMRRGQWLEKSQLDFAQLPSGKLILVNGHHRMHAQIAAGATILWSIVIHRCADEHEVRGLYYRFDTNLRKRTSSNILSGIGFAEDTGLSKEIANALWNAAPVISDGMRFKRNGPQDTVMMTDDRIALCREYLGEAKLMGDAIKLAPVFLRRKLRTASVFGVAIVTLKHCPDTAKPFWFGLCEDDGLKKGDPRKALLADMQLRSGGSGLLIAGMMASARCWNAWCAGREISHVKVTGHAVALAGTPYTVRA